MDPDDTETYSIGLYTFLWNRPEEMLDRLTDSMALTFVCRLVQTKWSLLGLIQGLRLD